ncbi:hypothetical protein NRIC_34310 [Enterococcus florum]|uniref:Uncharacterized protein n=1 Tax=Enterococcus florum TaxID=2480627 RepID=A0A4P5PBV6_9ENTE|nr:hypothetical protein [Enterococcus florum]GCF95540.1 hypothetical protein NRIC_34310 [Enterococcus florum]
MQQHPFTAEQLFRLSRKTLERRIGDYYFRTQNQTITLKLLLAIQIRDRLGTEDFTFFMKGLARHLYLNTRVTRAMKRYLFYFKSYFSEQEWALLLLKCFPLRTYLLLIEKLTRGFDQKRPQQFGIP